MSEPSAPRRGNARSSSASDRPARRPLLVNGERLVQSADRPPTGFGPGFAPYTIEENIERLLPQITDVRAGLADVPDTLSDDQLVVEARLLPQFLSASAFPGDLFAAAGLVHIGTKPDTADTINAKGELQHDRPTKTIFLAVGDQLAALQSILSDQAGRQTKGTLDDIRALDAIQLPRPYIVTGSEPALDGAPSVTDQLPSRLDEDGLLLYEAALHGRPTSSGRVLAADERLQRKFIEFVEGELGGHVEQDWIRESGSLLFMPVRLAPGLVTEAGRFNALRAVQPMARLRLLPASAEIGQPLTAPIEGESLGAQPLRVAVFDGGVDERSPYWQGRVNSPQVGTTLLHGPTQDHGAIITSALVYGHLDQPVLPAPANINITHFAALPQLGYEGDLDMYWLLDLIDQQVRAGEFDVVTICAAPDRIVTDGPVDRWTSTLDNLAHEESVLFVVAAGNNGLAPERLGLNRILVPGDATNVLTVGAADATNPRANRAPYSAVGPGRAGGEIRPSGLAFGGTNSTPFVGVNNDGTPLRAWGTSYAAPLLTHSLADLSTYIGRDRVSPVTLRAFALHFARKCASNSLHEVGHGHFAESYAFLLDGPANEAHILYRGTIARFDFIPLSIPVPDSRHGSLEVAYTLVTSTATDPSDSIDYTKAGLEITYRPHANRYVLSKPDEKKSVTVDSSDEATFAAYMREGFRPASEPATESIGVRVKNEGQLRAEGKWDSVRFGRHRYKKAEEKLYRPRIELTHLARENGVLVSNPPDLDWALLVTLRAATGVNLYDEVRAQFSVLAALNAPTITVQTRTA